MLRASAPRIQRGQEGPCGSKATVADQRASGSGATGSSRNSTTVERLPDVSFRHQRDILSLRFLLPDFFGLKRLITLPHEQTAES